MIKLLIAFLLISVSAYADSNVVKFPSGTPVKVPSYLNGNIGIGTSNPQHTLEVIGALSASSIHLTDPTLHLTAQSGILLDPNGSGAIVTVTSNGNVGVGSASPGQILDVQGTIRTTGLSLTTGAGNGKFLESDANGNSSWGTPAGSGTVTSVGLSSPNKTLSIGSTPITSSGTITSDLNWTDINGIASINTGGLNWASINGLATINSGGVNWQNIKGYQSGYVLYANTPNSVNWQVPPSGGGGSGTVSSGTIGNEAVYTGSTTVGSGIITDNGTNVGIGSATPGQALDIQGSVRILPAGDTLSIGTTATAAYLNVGSANGFQVNSTGNISEFGGNASSSLTATILSLVANGSQGVVKNNSSGSGGGMTYEGSGATNGNIHMRTTTGIGTNDVFQVDEGNNGVFTPFVIQDEGGTFANVGIGSTNPGQTLDIQGTVRIKGFNLSTSPTNNYVLTSDASGNGTWQVASGSSQWVGTAGSPISYTQDVSIGTAQSANLLDVAGGVSIGTTYAGYKTAPSNGLIVQGNVGIGTTVAGEGLVVTAANMRIDTAKTLKWGSDVGLTGNTAGAGYVIVLGQPLSANTTQIYRMEPKGTPANGSLFGVGNLKSSFEIFGSDLAADSSNYDRFMVMNGSTAIGFMDGASGTAIYKPILFGQYNEATTAVTEFVRFDTTGNVGIGSTAPGQKLDVNGTIRFTGSILNTKSSTGIGWTVHTGANTACNTTCGTTACVFGFDTGLGGSDIVACTDATADTCVCSGP